MRYPVLICMQRRCGTWSRRHPIRGTFTHTPEMSAESVPYILSCRKLTQSSDARCLYDVYVSETARVLSGRQWWPVRRVANRAPPDKPVSRSTSVSRVNLLIRPSAPPAAVVVSEASSSSSARRQQNATTTTRARWLYRRVRWRPHRAGWSGRPAVSSSLDVDAAVAIKAAHTSTTSLPHA